MACGEVGEDPRDEGRVHAFVSARVEGERGVVDVREVADAGTYAYGLWFVWIVSLAIFVQVAAWVWAGWDLVWTYDVLALRVQLREALRVLQCLVRGRYGELSELRHSSLVLCVECAMFSLFPVVHVPRRRQVRCTYIWCEPVAGSPLAIFLAPSRNKSSDLAGYG